MICRVADFVTRDGSPQIQRNFALGYGGQISTHGAFNSVATNFGIIVYDEITPRPRSTTPSRVTRDVGAVRVCVIMT
jgi:hypothetical protein